MIDSLWHEIFLLFTAITSDDIPYHIQDIWWFYYMITGPLLSFNTAFVQIQLLLNFYRLCTLIKDLKLYFEDVWSYYHSNVMWYSIFFLPINPFLLNYQVNDFYHNVHASKLNLKRVVLGLLFLIHQVYNNLNTTRLRFNLMY